jgi:hypothetical protein
MNPAMVAMDDLSFRAGVHSGRSWRCYALIEALAGQARAEKELGLAATAGGRIVDFERYESTAKHLLARHIRRMGREPAQDSRIGRAIACFYRED